MGFVQTVLPPELAEIRSVVRRLAHELFVVQAELARAPATPPAAHRIDQAKVERLERDIDRFDAAHPALTSFVLPGGSAAASVLHIARTVARRAERELVTLHQGESVEPEMLAWANRLSDLLFALALAANHALGVPETPPDYSA